MTGYFPRDLESSSVFCMTEYDLNVGRWKAIILITAYASDSKGSAIRRSGVMSMAVGWVSATRR